MLFTLLLVALPTAAHAGPLGPFLDEDLRSFRVEYSDARLASFDLIAEPVWAIVREPVVVELEPTVAPAVTLAVETEARRPTEADHATTKETRTRR